MALEPYRRGLALYGVYSGANQVWKKSKNFRRAAKKAFQRLQREARLAGPRQVNSTSLVRRLGPQAAPSGGDTAMPQRGNRTTIADVAGPRQFAAYRFRRGKKRSAASKRQSILAAMITRQRQRFSAINDLNAGRGFYFLKHGADDAQFDALPVYIFNLHSVRQGNTFLGSPFYRLQQDLATQRLRWLPVNGVAADGSTASGSYEFEDNHGENNPVGRKSFLDWVRIRMTIWGKQQAPGKVVLQMIQMPEDEYCPEFNAGAGLNPDADMYWKSVVKPLITNPSASQVLYVHKKVKVIKEWVFNFNPTLNTENDPDPDCKFFDVFQRVGKRIDYSGGTDLPNTTVAQLDEPDAYVGAALDTAKAFQSTPQNLRSSVYFVIKSMQQDKLGTPTNAQTASFDLNVQICHQTIQPVFTN